MRYRLLRALNAMRILLNETALPTKLTVVHHQMLSVGANGFSDGFRALGALTSDKVCRKLSKLVARHVLQDCMGVTKAYRTGLALGLGLGLGLARVAWSGWAALSPSRAATKGA